MLHNQLTDALEKQKKIGFSRDSAVVIGGDTLAKITKTGSKSLEKILSLFIQLTPNSNVVLACRVSPK